MDASFVFNRFTLITDKMNTIIGSNSDKNKITTILNVLNHIPGTVYVRYYHEHEFVRPVVFVVWLERGAV